MTRIYFLLLLGLCVSSLYAQEEITEAHFKKAESAIWDNLEKYQESLRVLWDEMPDKRDSIQKIFNDAFKKVTQDYAALAIKYASIPCGLESLYRIRLEMPKEVLSKVFHSLTVEMQQSVVGNNIREHLENNQIEKGDSIFLFPCVQMDGQPFDWRTTDEKQLLMLYGGLGCMGEEGREQLQLLYDQTYRDDFLIIVYWPCGSLEELQKETKKYPREYIFISDFKGDASPMKIKYGAQATPTCFLTDKQHTVRVKCTGLDISLLDTQINRTK